MADIPSFKLNTGALIPGVALGGFAGVTAEEQEAASGWMLTALQSAGYRAIDTAFVYGTEKSARKAIRESGIPREKLWITTKLSWGHGHRVEQAFQESLDNLGVDYVDLYLIHWPQQVKVDPNNPFPADQAVTIVDKPTFSDAWADMEKIYKSGRARAIGVSNFSIKTLEKLLETATVVPAVNQVEMHPYLVQPELKAYCDGKGIHLTAYAATGYRDVQSDPTIVALAEKYGVSAAQVALAWHLARGVSVACKSATLARQRQNVDLPTLAPEDVQKISALDKGLRISCPPTDKGMVWGWTLEQMGW